MKLHVAPVGKPEQAKATDSVKPLCGVTVIVAVVLFPAARLGELKAPEVWEKLGIVADQTWASDNPFTEPNPVTRSYPAAAVKPIEVVPLGQSVVPVVQGTLLLPVVTSWKSEGLLAANE